MSKLIHTLPLQLANQLAAGEVVERPASVIKELLENSLDAGATQIGVDVEEGGSALLRVCDNGCGIHYEDLSLALARHATSKIHSIYDLERIASLGFRGEALASIGSVSYLTLTSRAQDAEQAWKIALKSPDEAPLIEPAAHLPGTSVEVRDLFYNTPARRKFLRSEKTEFLQIEALVKRMALSHFAVDFTLKHNQKLIYRLRPAHSVLEQSMRIGKLCGRAFLDNSLFIDVQSDDLHLWGWLGLPGFARNQNDIQHFYVNGRTVRDRLINHAVRQAYEDQLFPGKQACFILFLALDPARVDVNVHPTKHEVRFRETRVVHDFISHQLQQALLQNPSHQAPSLSAPVALLSPSIRPDFTAAMQQPSLPRTDFSPRSGPISAAKPTAKKRSLLFIHQAFILAEDAHGIMIISIRQAHQQLIYQKLIQATSEEPLISQPLLIPQSLTFSEKQIEWLLQRQTQLQMFGIKGDRLGPQQFIIRALPAILRPLALEPFFHALTNSWDKDNSSSEHAFWCERLASMAAPHMQLADTTEAVEQLLIRLESIRYDACLKHLKPAIAQISVAELGLWFDKKG